MDSMTIDTAPDPMTTDEVAKVMRVGKTTVLELCRRGEIRHLRVGNSQRARILIYKADLRAWIESSKQGAKK